MIAFIKKVYWRLYDWHFERFNRSLPINAFEAYLERKRIRQGRLKPISKKTFDSLFED